MIRIGAVSYLNTRPLVHGMEHGPGSERVRLSYDTPATLADNQKFEGLVFDASGLAQPADIRALYDFFHPVIRRLKNNGRVVILAPVPELQKSVAERTAAVMLAGSALFVAVNEGVANWQAVWFAGLLVLLALTALRTTPAPG